MAELLALVSGDPRPRESAVADPRVGVVPRVSARHPPEKLAIVDHEVRERELVGVEQEGREAEREGRDPKVDKPVDPESRRDVGHHERQSETHVDGRAGESRVEDRERVSGRRESSACSDVARASERQVGHDGLGVNLGREDLKDGRH